MQSAVSELERDSRRGAFYTPEILAQFLVNWAVTSERDKIIDCSSGDGIFLELSGKRLISLGARRSTIQELVNGVEIDPATAKLARKELTNKLGASPNIINSGFFTIYPSLDKESYSSCIGNPPFVRYRNFFQSERELALKLLRENGFTASKLTNAWVPFLFAGMQLLKSGGRLAMVLPAELFQVSYASDIREYLLNKFGFVSAITFNRLVFPDVEQEIVLLRAIKGDGKGLRVSVLEDENSLKNFNSDTRLPQEPVQNSKEKWTQYFLNDSQRFFLRKSLDHKGIKKMKDVCSVDVGIVTGANDFFVLTKQEALELNAQVHLEKVLIRTKYVQGIDYKESDWMDYASKEIPSYLLAIKPILGLSKELETYLAKGRREGWNKHFKCSNREPWYVVPSVWNPDAFLFRQIGSFPKLVLNSLDATCTDTLHRVKFIQKSKKKSIVSAFHNSITLAFSEILGRSYGGGVLELMPTEAEKLPIPISEQGEASKFLSEIDGLMREGLESEAVELIDSRILVEELNFKKAELEVIRSAWSDLSTRRKSRKRSISVIG